MVCATSLMVIALQFAVITGACNAPNMLLNSSVGEFVELPSALGQAAMDDFLSLRWHFNHQVIVQYSNGSTDAKSYSQFMGRLELSSNFSMTVRELALQDSGMYQRTGARKDGTQTPKHIICLHVYEPITAVKIQSNITWLLLNLTCVVSMMCSSSGDQNVSYTWRKGNQTVSSRELHFTLSVAEGDMNIICMAANAVSEKNTTTTVRCSSTKSQFTGLKLYMSTGVPVGVAVFSLMTGVLVFCYRGKHSVSPAAEPGWEEITKDVMSKRRKSQCLSILYSEVALNHLTEAPTTPAQ